MYMCADEDRCIIQGIMTCLNFVTAISVKSSAVSGRKSIPEDLYNVLFNLGCDRHQRQ